MNKIEKINLNQFMAISGYESFIEKTFKNVLKGESDKTLIEWCLKSKSIGGSLFKVSDVILNKLTAQELKKLK